MYKKCALLLTLLDYSVGYSAALPGQVAGAAAIAPEPTFSPDTLSLVRSFERGREGLVKKINAEVATLAQQGISDQKIIISRLLTKFRENLIASNFFAGRDSLEKILIHYAQKAHIAVPTTALPVVTASPATATSALPVSTTTIVAAATAPTSITTITAEEIKLFEKNNPKLMTEIKRAAEAFANSFGKTTLSGEQRKIIREKLHKKFAPQVTATPGTAALLDHYSVNVQPLMARINLMLPPELRQDIGSFVIETKAPTQEISWLLDMLRTAQLTQKIPSTTSKVAISPDSTVLAIASREESAPPAHTRIQLWSRKEDTWTPHEGFIRFDGIVSSMALSENSSIIVIGSLHGPTPTQVWALDKGAWEKRADLPPAGLVLMSNDSTVILIKQQGVRVADRIIDIWVRDDGSWKSQKRLSHDGTNGLLAMNSNGSIIATGSSMAHTVQIIEHKDGSWLTEQKIATKSPGAITINPNGSMISVWPARGNVVYTLQRTRSVYLPKNTMHNAPEPISTTISADLSVAAHVQVRPPTIRRSSGAWHQSAQSTAVVTIWRHDDSSWHESYMLRPESPISSCAISPRGDVIALGSQNTTDIIFWPAALKKILDELTLAQISLLSDIYKYRTTHPHSLLMLDAEQEKVFASLPFAKTTVEDIKSRYAITTKKT